MRLGVHYHEEMAAVMGVNPTATQGVRLAPRWRGGVLGAEGEGFEVARGRGLKWRGKGG